MFWRKPKQEYVRCGTFLVPEIIPDSQKLRVSSSRPSPEPTEAPEKEEILSESWLPPTLLRIEEAERKWQERVAAIQSFAAKALGLFRRKKDQD